MRSTGIGTMLFNRTVDWCQSKGVRQLRIETQDTNVVACRFYQRCGCVLAEVNADAYPREMNEIKLIWVLELK